MRDYAPRPYLKHQNIIRRQRRPPSLAFDLLMCVGWYVLRMMERRRKISTDEWLERMRNLNFGLK
jgi:hypothetical protein